MSETINFKVERLSRGWSQERMAAAIGVSPDVIRTLEKGGIPAPANRIKIADFYKRPILDIWSLEALERAA